VNPLYLGTSRRRIFGVYEPAVRAARPRAAVLCYPWGAEYVYAHRSMRQLALRLAAAGFHTLRFDYYGTGDSDGDMSQADLDAWQGDTLAAIEGLKDIAGAARVTLIGLRLGGSIAAQVALRLGAQADALVLWDPVVSGAEYVASLDTQGTPPDANGVREVLGFPLTAPFRQAVSAIDLRNVAAAPPCRTLFIATERLESHPAFTTLASRSATTPFEIDTLAAPCPWIESVTLTGAVPVRVFQRIVKWLE
jgi:uncharacterized protein